MRGKAVIASATLVAFMTLVLWPRGVRADEQPPPAPPPSAPAAAPAAGNDDAAMAQTKQHFETGRNAYNAGDYVTAIREFKQAEQLRPSPILDYNIGLANEKLGKRRVAVKYYKRYLEEQPNAANKAEVEQKVAALEADIASQPPPAANAQPGGTAPNGAQVEQPGDMPPPDANATAAQQGQPGYDPYASQAPPGQPVAQQPPPKKKKSYWWIGLIIGGAVTLTIIIVVVAVVFADAAATTTTTPFNHALTAPGPNGLERHDLGGLTVLRF